jgi:hypothetical protein
VLRRITALAAGAIRSMNDLSLNGGLCGRGRIDTESRRRVTPLGGIERERGTRLSDLLEEGSADILFVGLIALLPVVAIFVGAVVVMIRLVSNR